MSSWHGLRVKTALNLNLNLKLALETHALDH